MSNMTILQIEWREIWQHEILDRWPDWKPNPGAEKLWYQIFKDFGKTRVIAAIKAMAATKPGRPRIELLSEILTPSSAKVNITEFSKKLVWLQALAGQTQPGILEQLPGYKQYKQVIAQLTDERIAIQYGGRSDQQRIKDYQDGGRHFSHAKNKVGKENKKAYTDTIEYAMEYYNNKIGNR